MPQISKAVIDKKTSMVAQMKQIRQPWWSVWRDIANYLLPMRYTSLMSPTERRNNSGDMTNPYIYNNTGTLALRTLAAGLMNGIASPARPWFKLRLDDFSDENDSEARAWLDDTERRMRIAISESNFYNALAVFFLDLAAFGTGSFNIYEDKVKLFHCQNYPLGEYYIELDAYGRVAKFAREFQYTVYQLVTHFGLENCTRTVRELWERGGAAQLTLVKVNCMIEQNFRGSGYPAEIDRVETYWETSRGADESTLALSVGPYYENPNITARWEVSGNDPYGVSPGMEALGDIKQLQHEVKSKAKGLDKMLAPPLLVDIKLQNNPLGMLPNGITFVPGLDANTGARPVYQVNPPIGEMTQDIMQIEERVRNTFFNFLFNRVSNLQTVRSAAEIDAIEREKLVLLGNVLERFENEGLDPAVGRIFGIMSRAGRFLPPPASLQGRKLKVQYVSIIAAAQSAAGTAAVERFVQFGGSLVAVWPEVREVPDITNLYLNYGRDLGVAASDMRSRDEVQARLEEAARQAQQNQQLQQVQQGAEAAAVLSKADVGGGQNALQRVLSGAGQ